jgi:hypothetical protein
MNIFAPDSTPAYSIYRLSLFELGILFAIFLVASADRTLYGAKHGERRIAVLCLVGEALRGFGLLRFFAAINDVLNRADV